jgi:hypothetical protein
VTENLSSTETIYIPLLNEGVEVWRPVQGKKVSAFVYRIETENSDPEDEKWQFSTGTYVRCGLRALSGGERLVAIEMTPTVDPET